MYVRPVSDLHNEFSVFNLPATEFDSKSVLILAGDIAVAKRVKSTLVPFLDQVAERFTDVLYIPGNHEYYGGGSLIRTDTKLMEACKNYQNVHYLNKKSLVIGGVRFIGATLWTDFNNADPMAMLAAQESMSDYKTIRTGTPANPYLRGIRPSNILGINTEHRKFIEAELSIAKDNGEKAVVFTHHAPSMLCRPKWMKSDVLDYAYYNSKGLEDMMLDYEPVLWIHGHSHYPVDFMLGNTRIVSNPRGYTKAPSLDEGLGFIGDLVIKL